MRNNWIAFVFLLLPILGFSQAEWVPYGAVKVANNFYVQDCEVSVRDWLMFYYYSLNSSQMRPNKKYLPKSDSMTKASYEYLFHSLEGEYEMLQINYRGDILFQLPFPKDSVASKTYRKRIKKHYGSVLSLPITNISYEQAMEYCAWLTVIANEIRYRKVIKKMELPVFVYQLPTKEQFMCYNQPHDSIGVRKKYYASYINYKDAINRNYPGIGKQKLAIASFYSNLLGLYDVQGNVAEMTVVEGEAVGGSYWHDYRASLDGQVQGYLQPEPWLGFRCVIHSNIPWDEWRKMKSGRPTQVNRRSMN